MTASKKMSPPFVPPEIADLEVPCDQCGKANKPNLWEVREEPFVPIIPNGQDGSKGAWIQVGVYVDCSCGNRVNIPVEHKNLEHAFFMYGDDADRHLGRYFLHSCSLIGASGGPTREMRESLNSLKKEFVPHLEPGSWTVHATKMINGANRIKSDVYGHLSQEQVYEFFKRCASIIKDVGEYAFNFHVTAVAKRKVSSKQNGKIRKLMKSEAHNALLSYVIYKTTGQGIRPVFTFDASKDVKKYPHIENWSFNTAKGMKSYQAYLFISHSNNILEPKLVKPGSEVGLELADVHAYFAARNMFLKNEGRDPEIPLENFGKFHYLSLADDGELKYYVGAEMPRNYYP